MHHGMFTSMQSKVPDPVERVEEQWSHAGKLFLASIAALYFELLVIRYIGTEIRVFTNLKNIPLMACFFGLGLGMILGKPRRHFLLLFPLIGLILFSATRYAQWLHLANVDLMWTYDLSQHVAGTLALRVISTFEFIGLVMGFCALIVSFFVVFGEFVGGPLRYVPGLMGYGVNLAGSLAGALLFSIAAFLNFGPVILAAGRVCASRPPSPRQMATRSLPRNDSCGRKARTQYVLVSLLSHRFCPADASVRQYQGCCLFARDQPLVAPVGCRSLSAFPSALSTGHSQRINRSVC